ncbi:hypothetical protein ACFLZZ_03525 [Nanoarchaeota archaeon]
MRIKGLILIIFAIITIISVVGIIKEYNTEKQCEVNADCIKVKTTCCPCEAGGQEACIPAIDKEAFEKELSEECNTEEQRACKNLYGCKIESCSCVKGACQ